MIKVWKCGDCFHANRGEDADRCYWCGGTKRVALYPVRVPNVQQGTPSIETLLELMAEDEADRFTDKEIEQQIAELIKSFEDEKNGQVDSESPQEDSHL